MTKYIESQRMPYYIYGYNRDGDWESEYKLAWYAVLDNAISTFLDLSHYRFPVLLWDNLNNRVIMFNHSYKRLESINSDIGITGGERPQIRRSDLALYYRSGI